MDADTLLTIGAAGVAAALMLLVVAVARGLSPGMGERLDVLDRRVREDGESLRRSLTGMDRALRWEIAEATREGMASAFAQLQEATAATADLREAVAERLAEVGGRVDGKLEEIRAGNEAKLEQMRRTVDEQLQTALEKRVGESFQRVADQFAQVQQAIGQCRGWRARSAPSAGCSRT